MSEILNFTVVGLQEVGLNLVENISFKCSRAAADVNRQ